MRVLICEDQDAIRKMIETLVSLSGHEVVGVASGAKAVELASTEPFDILLLDLMMPGLDGFEVCRRLRAQDSTKEMPIFVISAMDDPDSQRRATEAGATRFFGKPFRSFKLLDEIKQIADEKRDKS